MFKQELNIHSLNHNDKPIPFDDLEFKSDLICNSNADHCSPINELKLDKSDLNIEEIFEFTTKSKREEYDSDSDFEYEIPGFKDLKKEIDNCNNFDLKKINFIQKKLNELNNIVNESKKNIINGFIKKDSKKTGK